MKDRTAGFGVASHNGQKWFPLSSTCTFWIGHVNHDQLNVQCVDDPGCDLCCVYYCRWLVIVFVIALLIFHCYLYICTNPMSLAEVSSSYVEHITRCICPVRDNSTQRDTSHPIKRSVSRILHTKAIRCVYSLCNVAISVYFSLLARSSTPDGQEDHPCCW